jgi:hypothetical protein
MEACDDYTKSPSLPSPVPRRFNIQGYGGDHHLTSEDLGIEAAMARLEIASSQVTEERCRFETESGGIFTPTSSDFGEDDRGRRTVTALQSIAWSLVSGFSHTNFW